MNKKAKFEKLDRQYLSAREGFSQQYGKRELWNVIDHWPLYAGVSNIARFLSIYEILKEQVSVPGDIAEFGSWRGANLMFMTKVMNILDPLSGKQIHCFEGFEGLTEFAREDSTTPDMKGLYKGSLKELLDLIDLHDFGDTICIHKGLIEDTLPAFAQESPGTSFSVVYFDADLYKPALCVLRGCHNLLVKGGVFVFDEWNHRIWPGEGLAVREFMEQYGDSYEMRNVPKTRQPSLILRRIK